MSGGRCVGRQARRKSDEAMKLPSNVEEIFTIGCGELAGCEGRAPREVHDCYIGKIGKKSIPATRGRPKAEISIGNGEQFGKEQEQVANVVSVQISFNQLKWDKNN